MSMVPWYTSCVCAHFSYGAFHLC